MHPFAGGVREKIQLDVIKSVIRKNIDLIIDELFGARVRRVNGIRAIGGNSTAVGGAQQNITVKITGTWNNLITGLGRRTPINKWPPVNACLLSVGVAMADKTL